MIFLWVLALPERPLSLLITPPPQKTCLKFDKKVMSIFICGLIKKTQLKLWGNSKTKDQLTNTSEMVIIKFVIYSVVIPLTYHKKGSFPPIYKVSKGKWFVKQLDCLIGKH